MRLLQLNLGSDEILDLHPLVSVVAGLDPAGRQRLKNVVTGLAHGAPSWPTGLLEAHGVLFDLSTEMLDLLDIMADSLRPVVTAGDLPAIPHDPARRERSDAKRALAGAEQRLAEAREELLTTQGAVTAAQDALARARQDLSDAVSRAQKTDELRAELAGALAERERLEEELAGLAPVSDHGARQRERLHAAAEVARTRHLEAVARHAELEQQVQRARRSLAPDSEAAARRAADDLAQVEAEGDRARTAEGAAVDASAAPAAPTPERLEQIDARIAELDLRLAAFAVPTELEAVAQALGRVRPPEGVVLEPVPEAMALAAEIEALDRDLAVADDTSTAAAAVAAARARLEAAREALVEAELSVRNPELDRDIVNQLEQTHAELLDAIDKADSRFGGARAQRKVEGLREVEGELLEQLGFTSYSDYMMGYSLLNVDPEKEAALDAARIELSTAEDEWGSLQAETEAELVRAQGLEVRRTRLEAARGLLGRPVAAATVVDELRAMRMQAPGAPDSADGLRRALDEAGLALADEALGDEDLVLIAESLLAEVEAAPARHRELQEELDSLTRERAEAQVRVDAGVAPVVPEVGRPAEELRMERLREARELVQSTEARLAAHRAAELLVSEGAESLAAAVETVRLTEEAATQAAAELAAVADPEEGDAQGDRRSLEEALATAVEAESAAEERLRGHEAAFEGALSESIAQAAVSAAEEVVAAGQASASAAEHTVVEAEGARHEAGLAVAALGTPAADEGSVAEEIEWYILARLAAQRSVSLAGSLPLMLDDALGGLGEDELGHLLGRLERMAQAVQIIIVTDDPSATAWAMSAGGARAAVVQPQPA